MPGARTDVATSVTASTASLAGTVNPYWTTASYYFEYGTTTAYGSKTAQQSAGAAPLPARVGAPISGLAPGTTYHYRLVTSNSFGTRLGEDRAFTTPTDLTAPVSYAPIPRVNLGSQINTGYTPPRVAVRLSWQAATDASGIKQYELSESLNGGTAAKIYYPPTTLYALRSLSLSSAYGYQYCLRAQDNALNWSATKCDAAFRANPYQESPRSTSPTLSYSSGWTAPSTLAWNYTRYSNTANATATFTFQGRGAAWIAPKSTNRGKVYVYVNDTYKATIDLYQATSSSRLAVYVLSGLNPTSTTKVQIKVVGAKNPSSTDTRVDIDGFVVLK